MIAYRVPDKTRDLTAAELLVINQIEIPTVKDTRLTFICHSSLTLAFEKNAVSYSITLRFNCAVSCKCLDFIKWGGACKHIRGAVLHLGEHHALNLPLICLLLFVQDAHVLQACQFMDLLAVNQTGGTLLPVMHSPIKQAAIAMEDKLQESGDAYMVEMKGSKHDNQPVITDVNQLDNESLAMDVPDDELNNFNMMVLWGVSKAAIYKQTLAH